MNWETPVISRREKRQLRRLIKEKYRFRILDSEVPAAQAGKGVFEIRGKMALLSREPAELSAYFQNLANAFVP